MMTTDERKLLLSSHRQFEEIISDPTAKWDDIRKAMKAHGTGACTNAALVTALSSGMGPRSALSDRDAFHPASGVAAAPPSVTTTVNNTLNGPREDPRDGPTDPYNEGMDWNESETYCISTFQVPLAEIDGPHADKSGRTHARRGSYASCSSMASKSSVDLMNFGVDHFAEHDDESSTSHRGFASRASFVSSCTCETDGFIGWKHSDSKSTLSDSTYLSMNCDEDGFFAWEVTASARVAASEAEKIVDELGSITSEYEEGAEQRKSWHIEDYEGECFNDSMPTLASATSKTPNFLSSLVNLNTDKDFERTHSDSSNNRDLFWKRYTPMSIIKTRPRENPSPETDELDKDVRKALLNLRRSNQVNEAMGELTNTKPEENAQSKPTSLQSMFSGLSIEANPRRAKEKRRSTIDLPCSTFEQEHPKRSTCPSSFHKLEDQRDAIWINRSDGDVDIEKECRKLYLDPAERKPPPRSRRASFFGGEIPKVFKRNEDVNNGD